ncbi:hypothetical protein BJ912DRAFT_1005128 [Pholiota molesta]|nr:hypothetical protein BJ912DRAFT_1005128 [Pholiota molesta]
MLFKPFSRALVLVSVCAFFTAVASKPARFAPESLDKHTNKVAGTGTQTLKQFDARAMHGTHTHDRRRASAVAADRITPDDGADDADAAAPTPGNVVHVSFAAKPQPTDLSRRQTDNTGSPFDFQELPSNVAGYVGEITNALPVADNTAVEPISKLASL